jgi:dUTP pyrophosphatase
MIKKRMHVNIKRLFPDAKLPNYAHPGDVGLDMYARDACELPPGELHIFYVGWSLEFEEGYAAIVKDKGSVGGKGVITVGGVFDAGYRGEYNVGLLNLSQEIFSVKKGQKIAQLVLFPVVIAQLQEVSALSDSVRGDGRFGSTGKF